MRSMLALIVLLVFAVNVNADTMECHNGILDTAEVDPPTKSKVQQRCGEPDEERNEGNVWVYHNSEYHYVLRFSDNDELLDIQRSHVR